MMKRFSIYWRSLLLAVPMLACSLTSHARVYQIGFGAPSEDGMLVNDNQMELWTYAIEGTVTNLSYSKETFGLSFLIPATSVAVNSLTLTSCQTFSGKLMSISVECNYVVGLVIKAYAGQVELGELTYNGKNFEISSSSIGLLSENISLKFMAASGAGNGASVSGLSSVSVYIDESVFPIDYDSPVAFDYEELSSADLSNYSYKGILFTLNESNGDGFEQENDEGVIYVGTTLTDEQVEMVNNKIKNQIVPYHPGMDNYANDFSGGITMMVTRGKGIIGLEAETESNYAYHVKIGDAAPVEVASTTRQWLEVPYNVNSDTYILIYLVDKSAASRANNDSGRSGTRIGKRETAHGIVYSLRCASAPVEVTDISAYVEYIMGRDTFIFHNADVNNDYKINVADIVEILKRKIF